MAYNRNGLRLDAMASVYVNHGNLHVRTMYPLLSALIKFEAGGWSLCLFLERNEKAGTNRSQENSSHLFSIVSTLHDALLSVQLLV